MSSNARLRVLASLAALLLGLLSLRIADWQMLRGPDLLPPWLNPDTGAGKAPASLTDLNALPQPLLQRTANFLSQITRGSIYDRNGQLLASNQVDENGNVTRFYNQPALAPVLGYTSPYGTGVIGLERTYNNTLLGLERTDTRLAELLHQRITGSDLVLTIDSKLQADADRALAGKAGSVLVMDAKSGAVLAMASSPRFDPNRALEDGYLAGLATSCGNSPTCQAPLLNRVTQGLYPPGSTFKTITLIAGLDTGQLDPKMTFDFGKPFTGPSGTYYVYNVTGGGTIVDYNHKEQKLALGQAFARSANAAFAKIGDEMLPDVMVSYARRFGFSADPGKELPFELDTSSSQLANSVNDLYSNNMLRASTAIGQGELLATPLTMGEMVLAVVNDGNLPTPYLVESVKDPSGRVIQQRPDSKLVKDLMKPETAKTVKDMMVGVVTSGTGGNAAVSGLVVGGKTGTAQLGGSAKPHAWFVGFAQAKDRGVVIVVMIENGGEGSAAAAPIFAQMAKEAVGK